MRLPSVTLIRLVLIGFVLVAAPLLVAIVTAILQLEDFAEENQQALLTVQTNTSKTRTLSDRVLEMARSARQYQALGDATYRSLFHDHYGQAAELIEELLETSSTRRIRSSLGSAQTLMLQVKAAVDARQEVEDSEQGVAALPQAAGDTGINPAPATEDGQRDVGSLEAHLDLLRQTLVDVLQQHDARARQLGRAMTEQAGLLQGLLVGQAALVIPLSIGLALLVVLLISRPLKQLDKSIRLLGKGALSSPVAVRGARDLEELGERLDWLRVRLTELERQKSQFLRNVSHELKTPLTNIREAAELLDDAAGSSQERGAIIEILRNNSVRLQQMIEQLLQFGAEGDLHEQAAFEDFNFRLLVARQLEVHADAFAARHIRVKQHLQDSHLRGSEKRLQVVIDNLLSNAIKYTPHGGEIEVSLRNQAEAVELHVRDSGPGLRPQDRERVFEWFYTGAKPQDAIVAGTGMGLAISQEYAVQHGGEITIVDDEERDGAHFRLRLPTTPVSGR